MCLDIPRFFSVLPSDNRLDDSEVVQSYHKDPQKECFSKLTIFRNDVPTINKIMSFTFFKSVNESSKQLVQYLTLNCMSIITILPKETKVKLSATLIAKNDSIKTY